MFARFHRVLALGVALAAFGCSDPVPPAYKAGLRLNVTGTGACPTPGDEIGIGSPPPNAQGVAGKGGPIFDREQGVETTCRVAGGGPFNVSSSISGNGISFSLTGTVAASGEGSASVSVYAPLLGGTFASPAATPCTLTAVPTSAGVQVKPGAMWATFNCPTIAGQPSTMMCRLQGELVVENCDD